MTRMARSWVLYGGIAAFVLGCSLLGTPLIWEPPSDGQWLALVWAGTGSITAGIVAVVIIAFIG
jgi:hypothetical protein